MNLVSKNRDRWLSFQKIIQNRVVENPLHGFLADRFLRFFGQPLQFEFV